MKVYFLGCAGWIPNEEQSSCFMVEHKNKLFLLDAGTGVANLRHYISVLEKYDSITIVLSHYHLDHIIGLIYLLPYIKGKKLNIYGPGKPVYENTTKDILENLLQPVFFSRPLFRFCDEVKCFDYAGADFCVEDVLFQVKAQNHSAPSFRLTMDNKLIYATDTCFAASDWEDDYRGMTLLHECWAVATQGNEKHTSLESLVNGLPQNLLPSTFLIHKNPEWTQSDYESIKRMADSKGIQLARDGMVLNL